ncbi:maltokinase N-terminal cap-like domain-containing protein [Streptomyces sp. NPDC002853]
MSEAVTRPGITADALLASLDPLLRAWLPRQRWFAGKGRPITDFTVVTATELLPPTSESGLLHLIVQVRQPQVPGQAGGAPPMPADCYQLLLGVRRELPPRLAPALIGHATRGPLSGFTVYEALHDSRMSGFLLEALRTQARVGKLRFERDRRKDIGADLAPRVLAAEQSNSSLVYGDTYILKLFRRIVPGSNPDLELPLVLSRDGCAQVPPPAAWFLADTGDDVSVLGVLQPYLKGTVDGWELALGELAAGRDFTGEARALGRATAEVHGALARALPTVTLGRVQVDLIAEGMAERLTTAAGAVPALQPYAPALHTTYEALADLGRGEETWTAQRIHGDLHLGQCLRSPAGEWSLIDFEGEPSRPLSERRMPQPPVRDVAGMLRSFDYAARSRPQALNSVRAGDTPTPWAPEWAGDCRAAYCAGYAEVSGRDPRMDPVLLRAYETDKAVYEVLYEARHRPDWLPVPLAAIKRLATNGPATEPH